MFPISNYGLHSWTGYESIIIVGCWNVSLIKVPYFLCVQKSMPCLIVHRGGFSHLILADYLTRPDTVHTSLIVLILFLDKMC